MTYAPQLTASEADAITAIAEFQAQTSTENDPIHQAKGIYVTIHGHFYQPPRENPYLDTIERQPSAAPFHDWNERIHHECYRPNAFARILNDAGEVAGIVNNFEYLSFNIGPTLMSWLEKYDLETYQRIIDADKKSCHRLQGYGNAIAQVYNHAILPLANQRDKHTQIRWGKEDFRSRFGRNPQGMWLAETAVDYATLEALVAEEIKFVILAPSQAERCRPFPTEEESHPQWHEVGGSQIDPTRPYRCFLNNEQYIDIIFYDGPISRDMGFSDVLNHSSHLVSRLGLAIRGDLRKSQLISVATDGETFGHHKGGTEKCLAYAFTQEFPHRNWTVTNFAHYLSISPPTWEVIIKPVTAWSCAHGVGRWQDDCGCGGGGGWHQKWRKPLRDTLDWLRDRLITVYDDIGSQFFRDPWLARDEYIQVILDRSPENVETFINRHSSRSLSPSEQIDALRLLEMQRHALLMYTSCGWFFEEISRPEGVQILRYAARALELAAEVAGVQLEQEFRDRLEEAPSNVDSFKTGAEVYRQLVVSGQISFKQVAAHYAISSLFTSYPQQERVYCYHAYQLDYQLQRMGSLTLAVGQLRLVSEITWESTHLVFAVLHLGGWDFHCCIQPFTGRNAYIKLKDKLFDALKQASAAHTIIATGQIFGDETFSLQNLFAEERHRIMKLLSQETLSRVDQLYTQVYRDNYGVLMAFHRDELPVPQELQVAAEIALSTRCLHYVKELKANYDDFPSFSSNMVELEAIATEANHLHCHLNIVKAKPTLEKLILRSLSSLLESGNSHTLTSDIHKVDRLINLGNQLHLGLSLDKCQEFYFNCLHSQILPQWQSLMKKPDNFPDKDPGNGHHSSPKITENLGEIKQLLQLGQKLAVAVTPWVKGF